MKTERRHELQTNVLADKVAHFIEAAEPFSRLILAGVIAVIVAVFSYLYISSQQSERLADGWDSYFQALNVRDVSKLTATADKYPKTPVAEWSRLVTADLTLGASVDELFTYKTEARTKIKHAMDLYKEALNASNDPLVSERANFGLARAFESLGELEPARKMYEAVVENNGSLAGLAAARAADLKTPDTQKFFEWFAKYEPRPFSDKPDGKPGFSFDTMDNGNFDFGIPKPQSDRIKTDMDSKLPTTEEPATEPSTTDTPATTDAPATTDKDQPASETNKPAGSGDKPAGEGATDTKPSEPATDKPATDKPATAKEVPGPQKPAQPAPVKPAPKK